MSAGSVRVAWRLTPLAFIDGIAALRRERLTGKAIAVEVEVSPTTVSRILKRPGLNKLRALEPVEVHRYERDIPDKLIHINIKKLGKFKCVGHRKDSLPGIGRLQ